MKNQQEFLAMIEDYLERDVFPGVNFAILEGEEVSEYLFGKAALIPVSTAKLILPKKISFKKLF